jgi:hypothetical protein
MAEMDLLVSLLLSCGSLSSHAGDSKCTAFPFSLQQTIASEKLWDELQYIGFNWARRRDSDESLQALWYSQLLHLLNSTCTPAVNAAEDQVLATNDTQHNVTQVEWSISPTAFCNTSTLHYTVWCRTWVRP